MATYDEKRTAYSREPRVIVVISLDTCAESFGVSPCLATGEPCYNTRSTCKYTAAYNRTTKDYKFSMREGPVIGPGIRPYLESYTELPTEIKPEQGVAINSRLTLIFSDDEKDPDIGVDPYVSQRTSVQGSFWKKLLARNPYYPGRTVLVKRGYEGLAEVDYQTVTKGIIDSIKGPTNGQLKMVVKDYLKKADNVDIPATTRGKVADNPLAVGAVTINLDDAAEYEAAGHIRIGDEIIQYAGKSGNQLTGCTRGKFGTVAAQHSFDAQVQQTRVYENMNPWDIIYSILTADVGMAAADIDVTGAEAERDTWLEGWFFTAYISSPMKGGEAIREICEQTISNIWWNHETLKARFKVLAPVTPGQTAKVITDAVNIEEKSTRTEHNEKARVSRAIVYYNKDVLGDDEKPENYSADINIDADKESPDEYGTPADRKIFSRWLTQEIPAHYLANRILMRFRVPPKIFHFRVDSKDADLQVGDLCEVTTNDILDETGNPKTAKYQVLMKHRQGEKVTYKVMAAALDRHYGFVAPASHTNDWDAATPPEKKYAFIGAAVDNTLGANKDPGFYSS